MQDIPFVGVQEEQAPLGCCSATRATNIMSFGQLTQKINLMPRFLCQVCPCFTLTLSPHWLLVMVPVVMHTGL